MEAVGSVDGVRRVEAAPKLAVLHVKVGTPVGGELEHVVILAVLRVLEVAGFAPRDLPRFAVVLRPHNANRLVGMKLPLRPGGCGEEPWRDRSADDNADDECRELTFQTTVPLTGFPPSPPTVGRSTLAAWLGIACLQHLHDLVDDVAGHSRP